MKVIKTILPGQLGSQRFFEEWRGKLVCVRYRDDQADRKRYTTVEIIVDERPLVGPNKRTLTSSCATLPQNVGVKIDFQEIELREKVKLAGGIWLSGEKVWMLDRKKALQLRLRSRMVELTQNPK